MRKPALRLLLGTAIVALMAASALAETASAPRVVATYFHRTLRCQTCLQIEALARYDVTNVMVGDVQSGQLEWRLVNFEDEANAHFEEQFELDGPALVITLEDGDKVLRWVRMDRTWEVYGDVKAFDEYVLGTLEEYLLAASGMPAAEPASP